MLNSIDYDKGRQKTKKQKSATLCRYLQESAKGKLQ